MNLIDLRRLNCVINFYSVFNDCCLTVNFSPECSYIGLGFVNEHINDVFSPHKVKTTTVRRNNDDRNDERFLVG